MASLRAALLLVLVSAAPLAGADRAIPRPRPTPGAEIPRGAAEVSPLPRPPVWPSPDSAGIAASFPALLDDLRRVPPDSTGAVSARYIVTMLNSQVQFQTRSGSPMSAVTLDQFWAPVGPFAAAVFDPRIFYDGAADRWICSAAADSKKPATSSLLIGASQTSDPTGKWYLFRIYVDSNKVLWGDYPTLGFNATWVVASMNLFNGNTYDHTNLYLFSKSDLYAGNPAKYTIFKDQSGSFTPVLDYDNLANRLLLVQGGSGRNSGLRISEIQGAVGSETFLPGRGFVSSGDRWADSSPDAVDFAPQLGSAQKIDTGDSRVQNCVLRAGAVWCAQTVFLPAATPTRSAVQWWAFNPNSYQVLQAGRIDDASGVNFYAYPSVAVNRNNDVLIGYNHFSAAQYAAAEFSFRAGSDPPNALQDGITIKAGEAAYRSGLASGNRWGDYSTTLVDPADDLNFWTIQEYAASPAADGTPRWGTWWAQIAPQGSAARAPAVNAGGVVNAASYQGGAVAPGEIVTLFGTNLGPAALAVTDGSFAPFLAGMRVLFNGNPAPVIYTSATQASAIVPFGLAGGTAQLVVEYQGLQSPPVSLPIAPSAPALFTLDQSGSGPGAIRNQDNSVNSSFNPAARGSVVSLFGTGGGQTNPPGVDGGIAGTPLAQLLQPVAVRIGGIAAQVLYAGPAPDLVNGALQVNVQIPAGVAPGNAVVRVTVGNNTSPPVTVAVR